MPESIQRAWIYAAQKHLGQQYPSSGLPYLVHIGAVCLELFPALATAPKLDSGLSLCCAILHDTVEDTDTTLEDLAAKFGIAVAEGVGALTKQKSGLSKKAAAMDSLTRIRQQPHEIWLVKLADRAANLGIPPTHWSLEKCHTYAVEGEAILRELGSASPVLAERLSHRIAVWKAMKKKADHAEDPNADCGTIRNLH